MSEEEVHDSSTADAAESFLRNTGNYSVALPVEFALPLKRVVRDAAVRERMENDEALKNGTPRHSPESAAQILADEFTDAVRTAQDARKDAVSLTLSPTKNRALDSIVTQYLQAHEALVTDGTINNTMGIDDGIQVASAYLELNNSSLRQGKDLGESVDRATEFLQRYNRLSK